MAEIASGESGVPFPPRFWWLKRLSLAGVLLVVTLAGVRLWWGQHAGRLLAAEHSRMRAAGHPVEAADLNAPPLPPDRNAATFLQKAMAAQRRNLGPASSSLAFPEYPPFPPKWYQLADADAAANAAAFPLLRQARAHDAADWGIQFRSPLLGVLLPTLNPLRGLANFAGDAALREHGRGNDAAALELVRDCRHLSWAADQQPFLVSHLVSVGCEALALYRLQAIAPGLRVTDGDDVPVGSPVAGGPATRGQVRALIAELLPSHPRRRRAGPPPAIATERAAQADTIRWATRGNWVVRPLFQTEERRVLANSRWYDAAAVQQTWSGLRAVLASRPAQRPRSGPGRVATLISSAVAPSLDRALELDVRIETERRMTAVSLAAQLYRADRGAWPSSLDELVPEYLPAVPADPYAPAGEPLRYLLVKGALPSGADRPVVYSVSQNQADDTVTGAAPLPAKPQYGWTSNELDQRRDLNRWQPAIQPGGAATGPPAPPGGPPTSPEAVDDDPDEPDDPGQAE